MNLEVKYCSLNVFEDVAHKIPVIFPGLNIFMNMMYVLHDTWETTETIMVKQL